MPLNAVCVVLVALLPAPHQKDTCSRVDAAARLCYYSRSCGARSSMAEHLTVDQDVAGSSPVGHPNRSPGLWPGLWCI